MARFLRDTYVPDASERDAVGEERYSLGARGYNGIELDLHETYQWGWEQLAWVESEMAETAEKIAPGQGVEAAKDLLETDPSRAIEGEAEFTVSRPVQNVPLGPTLITSFCALPGVCRALKCPPCRAGRDGCRARPVCSVGVVSPVSG